MDSTVRTQSPRTSGAEKLPASGAWGKGNTAARSSSTATDYRGPPPGRSESSGCDPRAAASPTQLRPRAADLRLRTSAEPVRTRVWWPASQDPGATVGLLLFFVDARVGVAGPGTSAAWPRELASRAGIVSVSAPCATTPHAVIRPCLRDATTAWNGPPIMPRSSKPIPDGCLSAGPVSVRPSPRRGVRGAEISAGPAIARQLLIQLDVQGHGLPCSPHRRSTWQRPPWSRWAAAP
jgi:hypothetical protein